MPWQIARLTDHCGAGCPSPTIAKGQPVYVTTLGQKRCEACGTRAFGPPPADLLRELQPEPSAQRESGPESVSAIAMRRSLDEIAEKAQQQTGWSGRDRQLPEGDR